MYQRLVAVLFTAFLLVTQGVVSSVASEQRHYWKQPLQSAYRPLDTSNYPRPYPGYLGWAHLPQSGWVYFAPSYTFVAGKGIIGEACNLPTSACPNSERDNY